MSKKNHYRYRFDDSPTPIITSPSYPIASFSPLSTSSQVQARAVDYFYGRISRDEAEAFLMNKGCLDGLYLLRESVTVAGNYALSICYQNRIHHYSIELQSDGSVMIPDGRPFTGPIELIHHHSKHLDGFLVKPKVPCCRPRNMSPMAWPGVTMIELEKLLLREVEESRGIQNVFGPQRQKLMMKVAAKLHLEQAWYHGVIKREDAERFMKEAGHQDGKFLVRQRDKFSFALSLSYHSETKHYKVDKRRIQDGSDKLAIEDGPLFDNLMDMVAHYHNKMDGLLCKLSTFCTRPGWIKQEVPETNTEDVTNNPIYGGAVAETGVRMDEIDFGEAEEDQEAPNVQISPPDRKIYDTVPRTDDVFNLKLTDLILEEELGNGNFGSVCLGHYKHQKKMVPVAVKTLKNSDISAEKELMSEARLMSQLDHQYVVRMIGVCKSDRIMLVLELAALGPLHRYLKEKPKMSVSNIQLIMSQVAEGMAYLESKSFVHRDLAARNVLLSSEQHAKISDFGMSKAIGIGTNYYKAHETGKWPLKWYAPECLYFYKFDSKSDVWSFGVTLWEATSYGEKPYKKMKGAAILDMLDNDKRMDKPQECPQHLYDLMLQCWERKSQDRPTFSEIVQLFKTFNY